MSRDAMIRELEPIGAGMATTFANRHRRVTRDEMLSAASLAIVESVSRYDGRGPVTTFVYPRIKGQMIQDMRAIMGIGQSKTPPAFVSIDSVDDGKLTATTSLNPDEMLEEVDAVIRTLPAKHQKPARATLLGGLSASECAKQTGCPIGICKRSARQARAILRKRFGLS